MYQCGYCKKDYMSIEERTACENRCSAQHKLRDAALLKEKRDAERAKEYSEIMKLVHQREELGEDISSRVKRYNNTYFPYSLSWRDRWFD